MCLGGGGSPAPAPPPAQAAPVTAAAPKLDTNVGEEETSSETQQKKATGKKGLKIPTSSSATVNSSGSGLNIPQG